MVIHTVEDEQECDDIPDLHQTTSEITFVKNVFISKEEALPILRSLNEMQTEVFYAIRQWCVKKANGKNPDSFHLFISGGAGTGKSHLVKAIYYETSKVLANRAEVISQIRVLLTASTGVAAYNIKATTIHSTFSIPVQATIPYRPLAEEKLNTLKCRYENLELLIIGEISMVDYKLLSYIHGRLRQIKSASDEFPFGKVSIIAVGDFYQLPPVKASPLFKPNPLGDLWNGYFKLVELNEIMRQKGDKKFAEMLNRIRTKKKGEIMNACDISMLSQRETGETKSDIIHIYPTNAQVNEFNLKRLLSLDKEIVEIAADVLTPTVMLLRNIDATDGLVNGVIGTIVSIHRAESTIEVDVIHVRFDDHRVGAALRMRSKCRYEDGVPITKVEDSFSGRGSYKQFLLKLSWGCTIHKMQGVTVDAALVDFKKAFRAGQISECYDKNDDFFGQFENKKARGSWIFASKRIESEGDGH
uniref:ATP-dependent DNA helicase PIF1-like n=1 Tax=Styela clava TaxID=7725 RepID=UPI0019392B75|nr:ATP-dependent DNA helicase PIF1-like [Styela clava]